MANFQSFDMSFRNGMAFGSGVNVINGQVAGKAVDVIAVPPTADTGQAGIMDISIISSYEHLQESLGISVDVNGRYGLFAGDAKCDLAKSSNFNSQSTFVLARCIIRNPFSNIEAKFTPEANALLTQADWKGFTEKYGDGFVRGMATGGELFIIFEFTNEDTKEQLDVATSLHVEYTGFVSGTATSTYSSKMESGKTTVKLTQIQIGGSGSDFRIDPSDKTLIADAKGIFEKVNQFASSVVAHAVASSVQIANYITLPFPKTPNFIDIQNRNESLQDAAGLHSQLLVLRNDVNFYLENPTFYVTDTLPDVSILNSWLKSFTDQLNAITKKASHCADDINECEFQKIQFPDNWALKDNIKRKEVAANGQVSVPNVIGQPYEIAIKDIRDAGLIAQSSVKIVDNANTDINVVHDQWPKADNSPKDKGSIVTISYNQYKIKAAAYEMEMDPGIVVHRIVVPSLKANSSLHF